MGTGEGYNYSTTDEPQFQLTHDGSAFDVTTVPGGEYKEGQPIILILQKTGKDGETEYLVYQGVVEKDEYGDLVVTHPVFADPCEPTAAGRDLLYRATFVRVVKKDSEGNERIIWLNKNGANTEKKAPNTSVE